VFLSRGDSRPPRFQATRDEGMRDRWTMNAVWVRPAQQAY
jgi:hypothetical protein